MESDIDSEKGLKETIEKRMDYVVSILCDDTSDLEVLESKLKSLQIHFVLYCPFDPYNHSYDVIKRFYRQVLIQRKGPNFVPFFVFNLYINRLPFCN